MLNKSKYAIVKGQRFESDNEGVKWFLREQNTVRSRHYRRGECSCPKEKWFRCSTDCACCKYRMNAPTSLDCVCSESGDYYNEEYIVKNTTLYQSISLEDMVARKDEAASILLIIEREDPTLLEFGNLKLLGKTNSEISEILHIKRSTLDSRRAKLFTLLNSKYPGFAA